MSWNTGCRHAGRGLPYHRPWWVSEAYYALAYTHAKLIKLRSVGRPSGLELIDQKLKNAL
jgi:hypothetical protein